MLDSGLEWWSIGVMMIEVLLDSLFLGICIFTLRSLRFSGIF